MERGAGLPLLRRRLRAAAGPVGNDVTAPLPQVFPAVHILACFPGKVLTIWGSWEDMLSAIASPSSTCRTIHI